jgi:hypothetical protein
MWSTLPLYFNTVFILGTIKLILVTYSLYCTTNILDLRYMLGVTYAA